MSSVPEPPKSPTPTSSDGTVLPFPERFYEAVKYVQTLAEDDALLTDERRLMLYALHQQAEKGKCTEPKPWSWNVVESAKWTSWNQLGDMAGVEAMRLYVKFLETEIQPDWWIQSRGAQLQKARSQSVEAAPPGNITSIQTLVQSMVPTQWSEVCITGAKLPPPRYEHSIAVFNRKLYVIGGNCSGRYLNDVWTLDLDTLSWQQLQYTAAPHEAVGGGTLAEPQTEKEKQSLPPAFPQIAGHALVVWGRSILCIGGHTKSKGPGQSMAVRAFDTETKVWSLLRISGTAPPNRGSHTATLIGSRIYIFGGEEKSRRTSNDLFILNLTSLSWEDPHPEASQTQKSLAVPSARSGHVASAIGDSHLLIFGGGSVARCYADLWILDTVTKHWKQLSAHGVTPSPRAGQAAARLGKDWYIAGGGDNQSGCTDILRLRIDEGESDNAEPEQPGKDESAPLVKGPELSWDVVSQSEAASAIVSEGMGMVSVEEQSLLMTFGGYNGKYLNSIHVYRTESKIVTTQPSNQIVSKAQKGDSPPSTPRARQPDSTSSQFKTEKQLEELRAKSNKAVLQNGAPADQQTTGKSKENLARVSSLESIARDAQVSRDAAQSEVVLMRKQLNAAQEAKASIEKELEKTRELLSKEQGRNMKLEAALAEARQKLTTVSELERELGNYRKLLEDAEQKTKSKAGIWNYIAGTDK